MLTRIGLSPRVIRTKLAILAIAVSTIPVSTAFGESAHLFIHRNPITGLFTGADQYSVTLTFDASGAPDGQYRVVSDGQASFNGILVDVANGAASPSTFTTGVYGDGDNLPSANDYNTEKGGHFDRIYDNSNGQVLAYIDKGYVVTWSPVYDGAGYSFRNYGATVSLAVRNSSPPVPTPTPQPETTKCEKKQGGDGGCATCGGGSAGMARYTAHAMLASLSIEDTPIRVITPHGPKIDFAVTYNQRESQQPSSFHYSNLGPKWTFNWLAYVSDDPNSQLPSISVYMPGGGAEVYQYDTGTQTFITHPRSHAALVRTATGYERNLPDGSRQVFDLNDQDPNHQRPNGQMAYPRRFFMTKMIDPTGDFVTISYDGSFRVTAVKDQQNQGITFSYDLAGHYFKITKITETLPLGRHADFAYENGKLKTITDEIGIVSEFHYLDDSDFVDWMKTPYGQSNFSTGQSGTRRWIEMQDPEGAVERVEYRDNAPGISGSEGVVPNATGLTNSGLSVANTFYWDKKATLVAPGDYNKARITHWALNADGTPSGIVASEKAPLENRVWYTYAGQTDSNHIGTSGNPTQMARVFDNANPTASTQLWSYDYFPKTGKLKKQVDPNDPTRRVTTYQYDAAEIDLLAVFQQNANGHSSDPYSVAADKIAEYGRYVLHKPQDVFDAAGKKTVYTYNGFGQVETMTNPRNEVTTFTYGDGSSGKPVGFLVKVKSPDFNNGSGTVNAETNYAYDSSRRVNTTTTSPDNYIVTTEYDNLDRQTKLTYPDGTTTKFEYKQDFGLGEKTILNLTKTIDRRGLATTRHYNKNGQMDSLIEPYGTATRTTRFVWCLCGSLTGITDPRGTYAGDPAHTTTFNRDLQSRIYQKVFADGKTINFLYEGQTAADGVGTSSRLKSMTDAKNQRTNYSYGLDDNVQQISYTDTSGQPLSPATPTVSFLYDNVYNRVGSMTDGTGTTTYSYYAVDSPSAVGATQLQTVDGPLTNDAITYSYDELGRVVSRSINGVSSGVAYDSLGRVAASDNILGHFSRTYDLDVTSRLKTVTFPSSTSQTTNYSYYEDNTKDRRLQTIQDTLPGSVNVSKSDYAYNPNNQFDPEGHIGSWTKQLGRSVATTSTYTTDLADQLTGGTNSTTGNPSTSFSYGYDDGGNRIHDDAVSTYSINNVNQITNTGYAHDDNGNMTSDGVNTYEWDAVNRLTAIVYPEEAGRSEFVYDGLGRRVQALEKDGAGVIQRNTRFVWDGETIAEERGSSGTTVLKRFLSEGVQILANAAPNAKLYYSRDHLGSIRGLTNENGAILSTVDYDAYGSISRAPVPANDTSGAGPTITGAVSRLTHGSAGDFDVNLPLSGAPGIEMRNGAGNYTVILTFDRNVSSATSASVASGVASVNGSPTFTNNTATVQLTGVADRQTITLELDNVAGAVGTTAKVFVSMSVLVGDVNQNGAVTVQDLDLVKANTGQVLDNTTFQYDTNHDGLINSPDVSQSKAMLGQAASLFPDFAYTGYYYHPRSGVYLTLYRGYVAATGKWLNRDPIAEQGGLNLYQYVWNDPLNWSDELGLAPSARFYIYCKCQCDEEWRLVRVDVAPGLGGNSVTYGPSTIHTNPDVYSAAAQRQATDPYTRQNPATTRTSGADRGSRTLAHECGHTCQAKTLGPFYLPTAGFNSLLEIVSGGYSNGLNGLRTPTERGASSNGMFGGFAPVPKP